MQIFQIFGILQQIVRIGDIDAVAGENPHLAAAVFIKVKVIGEREVFDQMDIIVLIEISETVAGNEPYDVALLVLLDTHDAFGIQSLPGADMIDFPAVRFDDIDAVAVRAAENIAIKSFGNIQVLGVDDSVILRIGINDLIIPDELFRCIDNKSSGVFYLGRTNCGCCQRVCRYLNEVAQELGVTVYYIDVYNEDESLMDKEVQDRMYEYLDPILKEEEGEKNILTPQVFSVINGKFAGSQICFDNYVLDPTPTQKQIEDFKNAYRDILRPFSKAE